MSARPDRDVFEILRDRLREAGVGSGPWNGSDADDVIATVAATVDAELGRQVQRIKQADILRWAATGVADSHDARYRARTGPESRSRRAVRKAYSETERSAAARLVLEHALRSRAGGAHRVDAYMVQVLGLLARQAWQLHVAADRVARGLAGIERLVLRRTGSLDLEMGDRPPFRLSGFERATVARMAADRGEDNGDLAATQQLVDAMESGGPAPNELASVDAGLKAARGHGLVELFTALASLELLAGGNDTESVGAELSADRLPVVLADQARLAYPQVDTEPVVRALPYLTWSQELLCSAPTRIADYQEVPARLLSRPVMETGDGGFFIPRTVPFYASLTYILRILEGTWVEELSPSDRALADALRDRRARIRPVDGFERELAVQLHRLGYPHAVSIRPSRRGAASSIGIPLSMEIDAVIADVPRAIIWVVEAKDLAFPFSARRIRSELDKYFRPGGHRDKLAAKCAEVSGLQNVVADHLGAPTAGYEVRGLFVTREPAPAAFHDERTHEFLVLDQLPRRITSLDRHGSAWPAGRGSEAAPS